MRRFVLLLLLAPALASAQPDPGCAVGVAEAELDLAGVRARLFNFGGLFWRGGSNHYEVPRGSDRLAIFSANLMIGGLVDGDLRFAGSAYGPWEYWPGPLDAAGETTPERCSAYDRIWLVSGADLDAYHSTGTATADIAEWPVAIGAPFFVDADGDGAQDDAEPTVSLDLGDPGYGTKTIDLAAGERPVIFGRQTAWWVMNDAGGPHEWGGTEPLGIEVRVTAWVRGGEDEPELYHSTFYRYEILNRSAIAIEEGYLSLHVDPDLGNFNDDYVGSAPDRSMFYTYNGDSDDDGGGGYGVPPPALGFDILSGGSSAMYFKGEASVRGDPGNASEAYSFQQALWKDGTPLKIGGDGYTTNGPVTRWMFVGVPPAFWSEYDANGQGNANTPADRRGMITTELPTLAPGERATIDLAILFARGTDQIDSVYELFDVSDQAQALYDSGALTAPVAAPPAPTQSPTLTAPDDGAQVVEGPVTFSWAPLDGASTYVLEIATTPDFQDVTQVDVDSTQRTVWSRELPANELAHLYWRVRAAYLGSDGPPSPARALAYYRYVPDFESIEVVANANGPLDPPEPGAAAFDGYPTPGGADPTDRQQTNGARWLVTTSSAYNYPSFRQSVFPTDSALRTDGTDFEIRFTGTSTAYSLYSDSTLLEVPFELWRTGAGTPDDPSDDVRLIPVIYDRGNDRAYGFSGRDSSVSPDGDDPETDELYWHDPIDNTPGDAGYRAWLATADTAPRDHGRLVMQRMVLVGWDFGTAPPYAADLPEPGTIFRLRTVPRLPVSLPGSPLSTQLALAVSPNPARGAATVRYTVASAGPVRLRVLDVLGREVAVLADGLRQPGAHTARLDASVLAAGLYLVVLDAEAGRVTETITIAR